MGFDFPSKYARHLQSQKHELTVEFSFDGLALTDTSHPVNIQVETHYEGCTELNADTVPKQLEISASGNFLLHSYYFVVLF